MRSPKAGSDTIPPMTCDHVHRAVLIGPVARWIPIARIKDIAVREQRTKIRGGEIWTKAVPIGPEQRVGPFIDVRVPSKHEIDTTGFQNGKDVFPHIHQATAGVSSTVRIMRPFGVRRMVEIGNHPLLSRSR